MNLIELRDDIKRIKGENVPLIGLVQDRLSGIRDTVEAVENIIKDFGWSRKEDDEVWQEIKELLNTKNSEKENKK